MIKKWIISIVKAEVDHSFYNKLSTMRKREAAYEKDFRKVAASIIRQELREMEEDEIRRMSAHKVQQHWEEVKSEKFLDEIIERIKKKQL